jgi:hypothetical protein
MARGLHLSHKADRPIVFTVDVLKLLRPYSQTETSSLKSCNEGRVGTKGGNVIWPFDCRQRRAQML